VSAVSRSLVEVRRAIPADAAVLAVLYRRLTGGAEVAALETRMATALGRDDVEVLLAVSGEQVVGLVVLRLCESLAVTTGRAVHVEQLWVEAEWRRRGIARSLLAGVARTAERRGVDDIACSVPPSSRDVHRFLARLGFGPAVTLRTVPVGRLRHRLAGTPGAVDSLDRRRRHTLDQLVARRRRQLLTGVERRAAGT